MSHFFFIMFGQLILQLTYVENRDLAPGEQVVLDPGREGVTVRVYRNDDLISTDTYEAVSSIIQIGPQTEPGIKNK